MTAGVVVHEAVFPVPPSRVWAALTDAAALAVWFAPNDFRPQIGHRFTFQLPPEGGWDGRVHCQVMTLEPLRPHGRARASRYA